MCGIVGAIGSMVFADEKIFKQLLIVDALRGEHSTGAVSVTKAHGVKAFKKAVGPLDFLTMRGFTTLIAGQQRVLIGHNRYATKGAVNNTNAHPFTVGNVTGVHNGTLAGQHRLPDSKDFEVDSENIFHSINKIGIDQTVPLLDGAYVLVWVDELEGTFNILRNNQRPLFYALDKGGKVLYYASEPWMLHGILARNNVEHQQIKEFEADYLHTYSLDNLMDDKVIKAPRLRKMEGFKHPPVKKQQPSSKGSNKLGGGKGRNGNTTNLPTPAVKTYHLAGRVYNKGDKVSFFADEYDIRPPSGGPRSVTGSLRSNPTQEVQIYLPQGHPLYGAVTNMNTEFSAEIASMFWRDADNRGPRTLRMILNPTTLREVVCHGELDIPTERFAGYQSDDEHTEQQYLNRTKVGCGICNEVPTPEEAEDLTWVSDAAFICLDCATTPVGQDCLNPNIEVPTDKKEIN
tara:strand:+ start:6131 stop:7507 length:1377 start_codon:yes stop_codon:yes gene_type:complete